MNQAPLPPAVSPKTARGSRCLLRAWRYPLIVFATYCASMAGTQLIMTLGLAQRPASPAGAILFVIVTLSSNLCLLSIAAVCLLFATRPFLGKQALSWREAVRATMLAHAGMAAFVAVGFGLVASEWLCSGCAANVLRHYLYWGGAGALVLEATYVGIVAVAMRFCTGLGIVGCVTCGLAAYAPLRLPDLLIGLARRIM